MKSSRNITEIFAAVLERKPDERRGFIKQKCGGDPSLIAKIEHLLGSYKHAAAEDFLAFSALEIEAESLVEPEETDLRARQILGHYKILERIGAGGMGAIYLARRTDDFEKRVAVKIIKRGMDTEEILRRFRHERQILANLEHPNIAHLIDGGTTGDGLPFFVMEYVEGVPVDEYCEEENLSETARLDLFRKICAAVQFAHQKLIIHRDLKPSNILVNKEGEPKLLDFGIAKLLNSTESTETRTNMRILTPAYASPEQMRGEIVGTASDVYSLGLILSEMLGAENFSNQISNAKIPNSKFQNPNLKGDLQNILAMSLREDAARRYGSAEVFSQDIQRYLKGLPVSARKDSFAYRASKFIKRNRLAVGISGLLILSLSGGMTATLWQAEQAKIARQKAERRAENLRKLSNSFAVELHNEILNLPGSLHARQLLVTRAVEQLDALASESDGDSALQDELAEGYYKLGLLPSGDVAQIGRNFQKGVDLYTNLLKSEPHNIHFNQQLAVGYENLANSAKVSGKSAESLEYLQKAAAILEKAAAGNPSDVETRRLLFDVESDTTFLYSLMGRARDSLATSRKLLALGEELRQIDQTADDFNRTAYGSHYEIAKIMIFLGEYRNAVSQLQNDINVWSELQSRHPADTRYDHRLWAYYLTLSKAEERDGDTQSAVAALEKSLNIMENLRRKSPDDTGYQRNTSYSYLTFGGFYLRRHDAKNALPFFQKSRELSEKIYAADPEKGETIADLAKIYGSLGNSQVSLGNREEGLQNLKKSLTFYEDSLPKDASNALLTRDYAETLWWLGSVENLPEAKKFSAKSLEIWRDLQSKNLLSAADAKQTDDLAQNLMKSR